MSLKDIIGEYAFVIKLEVSNLQASAGFYENGLGLIHDPKFDTPTWMQFNLPGIDQVAIGLSLSSSVSSGGSVPTFVVDDIEAARQSLIDNHVEVGPIEDVGLGVLMAFFQDPDGNALALRQNPPSQPRAAEIGA
ncbi:MAG TPA: VOC family protein [Pyrinomonadaceae bacterium]|jgi:predicted enzyme related to lactoylglutathione lyase|nr:VOC family protein [Pyrinomonadaceae bacterium]